MTMQLMETHRREPSFTWTDVAFTVVTVRAQRPRAQRTSRWWLICEHRRTHSEKIHRRKKELLNMLFFFFMSRLQSPVTTFQQIEVTLPSVTKLHISSESCFFFFFPFHFWINVDDSGRRHDHWFIVDAAEGIFCGEYNDGQNYFSETTSSSNGDKHLHAEVAGLVAGSNPFHNSPTWELYRSPDDYLQ